MLHKNELLRVTANGAKRCVEQAYAAADKVQLETTEHLKTRATVVYRWKAELEHAIAATAEEMELLEAERRRVQRSLLILTIPVSIASEFLQLRSSRLDSDLVRDNVEEQLTKVQSRINSSKYNAVSSYFYKALCPRSRIDF